ncbi:septum formation initiator family protein [Occultella glacieicola]|uniref:Septum formation initiator family protein n=1 Tax=Occultella glacieicola TaxID=2518684 RepID=A0ABY2E4C6_9MICO|nr:septum formation initiator family protein [Occultella glacieicola]TDE93960.1 septum formation initiator family protein [Occultella glacieicola]
MSPRRPATPRARGSVATAKRPSSSSHATGGARATGTRATASGSGTGAKSAPKRAGKPTSKPTSKPATKPSAARRAGAAKRSGATTEAHKAPRQITVRTLVLFVVVLMAFIVLAPTLRAYITQQERHRELSAQIVAAEQRNADLNGAVEQWNDDAYVQAQARDRLGFVMPGETPYRVVDPETVTGEEPAPDPGEDGPVSVPPTGPWYLTVWDSVQVAGEVSD